MNFVLKMMSFALFKHDEFGITNDIFCPKVPFPVLPLALLAAADRAMVDVMAYVFHIEFTSRFFGRFSPKTGAFRLILAEYLM